MIKIPRSSNDLQVQIADIQREDLFEIGVGKDRFVGTFPCFVPPGVVIAYNRVRMNQGDDAAATWALELLLGREGVDQLISSAPTEEQLDQIFSAVLMRVRGATRGEPGKGTAREESSEATSSSHASSETPKLD